jgi:hypothetical protein
MYKRYTFERIPAPARNSQGDEDFKVQEGKKVYIMKKKESEVRKKMVVVRLNESEDQLLQKFVRQTTEKTVSNYLRKLALGKPVTVKYRNASADDFLRDMLELKKEISAIGNNYNQAVKKLHILEKIPEFRSWILMHEKDRMAFLTKVTQIQTRVQQLYDQWLQK